MKSTFLLQLCGASVTMATYVCPASLSMVDAKAIGFAYTVQGLLEGYYRSVPLNVSFFSDLPMAMTVASNGMTLAENTLTNVQGLTKQAELGSTALMEMGRMLGLTPPPCTYTFPAAPNGMTHLMNAYSFEATMCGTFIGLADYFQSPTLNSLSARLAAEHGIHASAIRAMMQSVGFMPNSTMLTPAFTPDMVLQDGTEVGMLGSYLGGCVAAPAAPCGGSVSFGPLLPTLTNGIAMGSNVSSTGMPYSTGASPMPTTSIMPFTGGADAAGPLGSGTCLIISLFAAVIIAPLCIL